MPMPGNPAWLNAVLSEPPSRLLRDVTAPTTPSSLNGSRISRSMFGGFRWSKHSRAAHASGAGIDIEVAAKFLVTRFWIFKRTEMLFDVSD